MSKPYDKDTIKRFSRGITEDEYNDQQQLKDYGGQITGYAEMVRLLDNNLPEAPEFLIVGAGSTADLGIPKRDCWFLEPNAERLDRLGDEQKVLGWCENIETNKQFGVLICWGTLRYVRSLPESLIQFNDHLVLGGKLILDVVVSTIMPLAQTANPDSFVRYADLFGFALEQRLPFGHPTHRREGFRFKKYRSFDPAYLRIPQSTGKINNFLFERDWFLA